MLKIVNAQYQHSHFNISKEASHLFQIGSGHWQTGPITSGAYREDEASDRIQYNQGNVSRVLGIQIRGGLKFPEGASYSLATKYGFHGGISFIIPLSETIDLQPEINYSNSPIENIRNDISNNNITTNEYAILLGYNYRLENFTLRFTPGFGILLKSKDTFSSSKEKLLAFNLGIEITKKVYTCIYVGLEFRKQWAFSFNTSGGSSFNPYSIDLGIIYYVPKTTKN